MNMLDNLTNFFYSGGGWSVFSIGFAIFRILLFFSLFFFVLSIGLYFKKYKILKALFLKITGNVQEFDRIRRTQMRIELDSKKESFAKNKKKNIITDIYLMISRTGIIEKIPGFSEFGFLIIALVIASAIFLILFFKKGFLVALVATAAFLVVLWYAMSLIAYNRKMQLEGQLLSFTNECASASMQYANIIDIFGAIYEQFSSPLREGLEACYVEAKQTSNKEIALKHLKERYDSVQFSFVLDNLELCSDATGDYYTVARDIADPVSVYNSSHEKKRVVLRNSKVTITTMLAICIAILSALSAFLGNVYEVLLNTTIGNISLIALVLLYFYGLNIKSER